MPYGEDLAYIHDVGFGDFSSRAASWLLQILERCGCAKGHILDLGCGSGIWAGGLIQAGYAVTGLDISESMIQLARARAPEGRFIHGSFFSDELPACDAVTSLGECFSYDFGDGCGKRGLVDLLRRIHAALRPGGLLIFDLLENEDSGARHFLGPTWAVLVELKVNNETMEATRRITSFRKIGHCYRRTEEIHRLRLYNSLEMARDMRELGFRVRRLKGYGSLRFRRGQIGFLARKR